MSTLEDAQKMQPGTGPGLLGGAREWLMRQNIREYGMYIALLFIMLFFTILTNGVFLSARNISDLVRMTSFIAVMAVGMTLVIVIRHIDLSVGYFSGFIGALVALCLTYWHIPVGVTIPLVLLIGTALGLVTAFFVAQLKIPAFVATLAGWLAYQGALLLALRKTGTIVIENDFFTSLGNGFVPDIPGLHFLAGLHKVTLLLGLLAIILFVFSEIRNRRKTRSYDFDVLPMNQFLLKLVILSAVIAGITLILAGYQGLSWAAVILLVIVLIYHYVMSKTVTGRHIYAVGGNPEAAQLNGISVKKITFLVFGSMGALTAVGGVLYSSWLYSATAIAGQGLELDTIAAAFVGGAAVSGGVGKVTGSIVGAFVMASVTKGMQLLVANPRYADWTGQPMQYLVRALVLLVAVVFDVATRKKS